MGNHSKDARDLADRVKRHCREAGRDVEVCLDASRGTGNHRWTVREGGQIILTWSAHSGHSAWRSRAEGDCRRLGLLPQPGARRTKTTKEEAMPTPSAEEKQRTDELRPKIQDLHDRFPTRPEFARAVVAVRQELGLERFGGEASTSEEPKIVEVQVGKVLGGTTMLDANLRKWEAILPRMQGEAAPQPEPEPEPQSEPIRDTEEYAELLAEAERERDAAVAERDAALEEVRQLRETEDARASELRNQLEEARRVAQEAQEAAESIATRAHDDAEAWRRERNDLHERIGQLDLEKRIAERAPRPAELIEEPHLLPLPQFIPPAADPLGYLEHEARRRYLDLIVRLMDRVEEPTDIPAAWFERLDELAGLTTADDRDALLR